MKSLSKPITNRFAIVAPHTGAWIEIFIVEDSLNHEIVAPHTGAWIEITLIYNTNLRQPSLPTRERGLKYQLLSCNPDLI